MKLLGLTGGIGTGKTTVGEMMVRHGARLVDTDIIAREVVEPGQPVLAQLTEHFGASILRPDGALDRAALAAVVFATPPKREQLEAILHPPIRARWRAQVQKWRAENVPLGVVVIPLLFETNAQAVFDLVICTGCSAKTQQQRLQGRGWSVQQVSARLAAQWPLDKKIAASSRVIWTEGTLEITEAQVQKVLASLT